MLTTQAQPRQDSAAFPRADRITTALAAALVIGSITAGLVLNLTDTPVQAEAAPLYALWQPHLGPGTPAALAVAAAVILHGPRLAATLAWRRLLAVSYAAATLWTFSLAMIDGWQRGLAGRLTAQAEYLTEVDGVTDIPTMLREFTGRILDYQPDSWTTHVSGHPPGALLMFVWLDRIGLGGGGPAAIACILAGALAALAVPVTLRTLGQESAARTAVPFVVLLPGAVWIGVSADGLFAGLTSTALALLAIAVTTARQGTAAACGLGAGAVLAFGCYLSYGLVLIAPLALAVLAVAARRHPAGLRGWLRAAGRALTAALIAAVAVVVAFTAVGFWWLDGYHLVVQRYYQGIASERAYDYWVWANLAALLLSAGPAAAVIVRRVLVALPRDQSAYVLLPAAAALSIAAADLSGLSKAEVERIWLPFIVWLPVGALLLPAASRRGWLIAGAITALTVNHLLLTIW
ncbi:hypothetical protein [Catellatospora citrea]|uniref:Dolichyl-phosphate-mannose-protein mannosyltransferase n=1 Tax=Catellatospora citrea TaxID=53366 RepID=A0A8J3KKV7_9ACTN|nr:hypothetical protein [Catellatospora citrea]RKE10473.1 hypothetical protein C8E86_5376 [Catellatospora citrea]GIF99018.1 hypothetical protein Cci01nite_41120 [Catellatospora citrea]